ncbi:hypothetical protein GCM10025751_24450 [Haladaptatus pallidirubidus]|uniref:Uncharacterized protein n=1 Tax=Haladaptatus pallidirubidus TaxID=1008152 RepID=A0AAV3UHE4_9EURY
MANEHVPKSLSTRIETNTDTALKDRTIARNQKRFFENIGLRIQINGMICAIWMGQLRLVGETISTKVQRSMFELAYPDESEVSQKGVTPQIRAGRILVF